MGDIGRPWFVYRYPREALDTPAAMASTSAEAIVVACGKAYVILAGTLLRIECVGVIGEQGQPLCSGEHKAHGVPVDVAADPAGRLVWVSSGPTRYPRKRPSRARLSAIATGRVRPVPISLGQTELGLHSTVPTAAAPDSRFSLCSLAPR